MHARANFSAWWRLRTSECALYFMDLLYRMRRSGAIDLPKMLTRTRMQESFICSSSWIDDGTSVVPVCETMMCHFLRIFDAIGKICH